MWQSEENLEEFDDIDRLFELGRSAEPATGSAFEQTLAALKAGEAVENTQPTALRPKQPPRLLVAVAALVIMVGILAAVVGPLHPPNLPAPQVVATEVTPVSFAVVDNSRTVAVIPSTQSGGSEIYDTLLNRLRLVKLNQTAEEGSDDHSNQRSQLAPNPL